MKRSPATTYRKKRAVTNTQEETRQKSAGKAVGNSGQDRDETPKDRTGGEVDGGFPDMIEEHVPIPLWPGIQQSVRSGSRTEGVRGNLRGDIPGVEDTQDGVELLIGEAQILFETAQTSSAR